MTEEVHGDRNDQRRLESIVESGSEIAGAAVGGGLGFITAGAAGAAMGGAAGAAATAVIRSVGLEACKRLLGPREEVRVGGTLAIAAAHIRDRVEKGENIRNDGFFTKNINGRSDAEEVTENIILKCQREPEEKKIVYMANIHSNVVFDTSISAFFAHQMIKNAESMTYRQLCILKIAGWRKMLGLRLRERSYRDQQSFDKELRQILFECLDLCLRGFLTCDNAIIGVTDIVPNQLRVQGVGADMCNTMGLAKIPPQDLDPIVFQLQR